MVVSRPIYEELLGFSILLPCTFLEYVFYFALSSFVFVHFHLLSVIVLQNMFSRSTSGTRLIIYACVKVCLFLLFWIIFGGYKCAIVTANNPHEEDMN
jgi:hypothetical protein